MKIDHSTEPCAGYLFASVPGERERTIRHALANPVLMIQRPDLRARAIQAFDELHPSGVADPAAEETAGEAVEAVDDFARSVQSVLYTPGLSDTETVNRITAIVDGHLAAEDRSDG